MFIRYGVNRNCLLRIDIIGSPNPDSCMDKPNSITNAGISTELIILLVPNQIFRSLYNRNVECLSLTLRVFHTSLRSVISSYITTHNRYSLVLFIIALLVSGCFSSSDSNPDGSQLAADVSGFIEDTVTSDNGTSEPLIRRSELPLSGRLNSLSGPSAIL